MASTPTRLMTFAEFEQLPDPKGGRYELHHGEMVFVAPPEHKHFRIQDRITDLLKASSGISWKAAMEMPFRPKPDHEYWKADVGLISKTRYDQTDPEGNIQGALDLVIEVLSPSNSMAEMLDKRQTCLEGGAREFWLVNPNKTTVEVSTPDGHSITYSAGQQVPLFFGGAIAVDEIFL